MGERDYLVTMETREADISKLPWNPAAFGRNSGFTDWAPRGVIFLGTAVVHTVVPVHYAKLCRMYLRWDRSYIREEIRFAGRIVWKRPPIPRLIAVLDSLITNLRYPVGLAVLPMLALFSIEDPMAFLRVMAVIGAMAGLNMLYYLRSELSWDFLFGIFYAYFSFFALFWIFPYAAATLRARSWLTR